VAAALSGQGDAPRVVLGLPSRVLLLNLDFDFRLLVLDLVVVVVDVDDRRRFLFFFFLFLLRRLIVLFALDRLSSAIIVTNELRPKYRTELNQDQI
jgi:hypothetical protein